EAVWTWDATHNPEPLTPAQAGLVELVDEAQAATVRQRLVLGYLYTTRHGAPGPLRRIPAADLPRVYPEELAPALTRAVERMGDSLEDTLAGYLELYRLYARVLAPSLRDAGPIAATPPDLLADDLSAAWDVGKPTYGEHLVAAASGWRTARNL